MVDAALFLLFVVGLVLVALGAWWISPPAGLIVGGAALSATVFLYARGDED